MNNEAHRRSTNMNIVRQLTRSIVDSAVDVAGLETEVLLHRLPAESLREANDACLADMREAAASQSAQPPSRGDANGVKNGCRPTKRLKASEGTATAEEDDGEEEVAPTKDCRGGDQYYDEGVNFILTPVLLPDLPELHLHSSGSMVAALLYNLGLANLRRDQTDTALRLFHLSLDVCQRDGCTSYAFAVSPSSRNCEVDEISLLHNIGCIHYRRQEYDRALETFTRVEVLALIRDGSRSFTVASALNCIGVVLFHGMSDSHSQTALDNLLEGLSVRRSLLRDEDRDVATSLNNVGRVYFDNGDYRKAQVYYQESLRIRRTVLGPDHVDVSATAFNAGQTCHRLGELDKSLPLYREYYEINTKRFGVNHQGTIAVLKHIGQVYHEKNRVEEALSHYRDALDISRAVFGRRNREAASILNLLGNLHYEHGQFDLAVEVYEEGLSIERAILHRHSNNIVVTLSNIGQALMQQGEYQAALQKYNEVHFIQCLQSDRNARKISETLSICGQINTLLGKYPQAEKAFLKVISMTREASSSSSSATTSSSTSNSPVSQDGAEANDGSDIDVALALNYLGLVHFKRGDLDSAMMRFRESLRVRLASPEVSGDVAVLLYNIASIYLHKGDSDGALEHYERALDVERAALGEFHPDVAVTLKLIGKVYDRCGRYDEAVERYEEALGIHARCYGGDGDEMEIDSASTSSSTSSSPSFAPSSAPRHLDLSTFSGAAIPRSTAGPKDDKEDHKRSAARVLALIASVRLRRADAGGATLALAEAHRLFREVGEPDVRELELEAGFDLYELSILHPECAAAA